MQKMHVTICVATSNTPLPTTHCLARYYGICLQLTFDRVELALEQIFDNGHPGLFQLLTRRLENIRGGFCPQLELPLVILNVLGDADLVHFERLFELVEILASGELGTCRRQGRKSGGHKLATRLLTAARQARTTGQIRLRGLEAALAARHVLLRLALANDHRLLEQEELCGLVVLGELEAADHAHGAGAAACVALQLAHEELVAPEQATQGVDLGEADYVGGVHVVVEVVDDVDHRLERLVHEWPVSAIKNK